MKTLCWLLFFTAASLFGQTSGTTLPTNCVVGAIFVKTNAPVGQNTYVALATAAPCTTWTLQGDLGGCTATAGQMSCPNGFASTSGLPTLAEYNTGTAPSQPAAGKGRAYSDSTTKGFSFKDENNQITRTVKPTDCTSVGLVQKINADGTVGCAAGGGGGMTDPTTTAGDLIVRGTSAPARLGVGSNGQVLTADSTAAPLGVKWATPAAGGGGGATAGTVYTQSFTGQTTVALAHNLALSPTTAFTAQCFDATGNIIVAANIVATDLNTVTASFGSAQTGSCTINAGGGSHFYAATMSSATTWTVAGTTHKLGTCDLDVMAWDAASGVRHKVAPADISCDDTAGAFTVTVSFGAAQAGRLVLIAAK